MTNIDKELLLKQILQFSNDLNDFEAILFKKYLIVLAEKKELEKENEKLKKELEAWENEKEDGNCDF